MRGLHVLALSPARGAETMTYLATAPEVEGVTGQYFVKKRAVQSAPVSYDRDVAQRLWRISAEMVGL